MQKHRLPLILIILFTLSCYTGKSQTKSASGKKESLVLSCLLLNAKEPVAEKPAVDYGGEPENKLVLASPTDTIVKACTNAVVSTIQRDADGTYEVVFYHNDYWFWLSGLTRVSVAKNANIKEGQQIGILAPGKQLELLMFDFETPVDPKDYMKCK